MFQSKCFSRNDSRQFSQCSVVPNPNILRQDRRAGWVCIGSIWRLSDFQVHYWAWSDYSSKPQFVNLYHDPIYSLFCFRGEDGGIHYAEAGASLGHTRDSLTARLVRIFEGGNPWDEGFKLSESRRKVVEVILILPREATKIKVDVVELQGTLPLPHTPVFMCIGLSYKKHADEAGISLLSRLKYISLVQSNWCRWATENTP